jgi:hypothetical protein
MLVLSVHFLKILYHLLFPFRVLPRLQEKVPVLIAQSGINDVPQGRSVTVEGEKACYLPVCTPPVCRSHENGSSEY